MATGMLSVPNVVAFNRMLFTIVGTSREWGHRKLYMPLAHVTETEACWIHPTKDISEHGCSRERSTDLSTTIFLLSCQQEMSLPLRRNPGIRICRFLQPGS
jgi:hypothetical protein